MFVVCAAGGRKGLKAGKDRGGGREECTAVTVGEGFGGTGM